MKRFQIKEYGFSELALMYYPDRSPRDARRRFREELSETRHLNQTLRNAGYKGTERILSRNQVRIIVECIGEP